MGRRVDGGLRKGTSKEGTERDRDGVRERGKGKRATKGAARKGGSNGARD